MMLNDRLCQMQPPLKGGFHNNTITNAFSSTVRSINYYTASWTAWTYHSGRHQSTWLADQEPRTNVHAFSRKRRGEALRTTIENVRRDPLQVSGSMATS